jgi:hypothetical protein
MATEVNEAGFRVIMLDRAEAANLIGLLAAQLAGTTLQGNVSGAAPSLNIEDRGVVKYRLVFLTK